MREPVYVRLLGPKATSVGLTYIILGAKQNDGGREEHTVESNYITNTITKKYVST